ncbi:MAG: hypothetical protein QOK05_2670 [Chloroflexota bacterium]|jgi:hypothetical protein|nr:hypothetical protein [Chloroflexota bacterium]
MVKAGAPMYAGAGDGDVTESDAGNRARGGASRREFLAGAGLTGVALASGAWQPIAAEAAAGGTLPQAAAFRSTSNGFAVLSDTDPHLSGSRLALTLDGSGAGYLNGVGGGRALADVVVEKLGTDGITHKHLAGLKYEEFELEFGPGMDKTFYDWIATTLDGKDQRKDGGLVGTDFNGKTTGGVDFFHALITEVGFPAADASAKDAARLTLKIAPEFTRFSASPKAPSLSVGKAKTFMVSNFRLTIDGLDTTRVNKVEAITITRPGVQTAVGEARDFQRQSLPFEYPNLVVTFAESSSQSWLQWHESFVIKGDNGSDKEKEGKLEFLSQDLKEVLFTLQFSNLGIFKLGGAAVNSGSEAIRRLKAEMYSEKMSFKYGPGSAA